MLVASIIFAVILTTVVALTINNTASAVIDDYKGRFSSEVLIRPNMTNVMSGSQGGQIQTSMRAPIIDPQLYLDIATWDRLDRAILTGRTGATSALERVGGLNLSGGMIFPFQLHGDNWRDFEDGYRALTDGSEYPAKDYECIISTALCDLNNIKIGDTVSFIARLSSQLPDGYNTTGLTDGSIVEINGISYIVSAMITAQGTIYQLSREVTFELVVVGFYNDITGEANRQNEILTTIGTLLNERGADEGGISITASYFLKNPDDLSAFEEYARSLGLPVEFSVTTDVNGYNRVVKPVVGLKNISIIFMIVVLALGAIILLLLMSIAIRERKYEIGVLRAMGMKKGKVALGLWTEILAITCFCLVIGLGVGAVAAQPVSDIILKTQVEAAQSSTPVGPDGRPVPPGAVISGSAAGSAGLVRDASSARPLSEMNISLNLITVLEIIGISLLLASLAGLVSISKITKYEPIKILMERN